MMPDLSACGKRDWRSRRSPSTAMAGPPRSSRPVEAFVGAPLSGARWWSPPALCEVGNIGSPTDKVTSAESDSGS